MRSRGCGREGGNMKAMASRIDLIPILAIGASVGTDVSSVTLS